MAEAFEVTFRKLEQQRKEKEVSPINVHCGMLLWKLCS